MNVLPDFEKAIIQIEKFTEYVLHPVKSRGKWLAFRSALGYHLGNVDILMDDIRKNLTNFPAESMGNKGYGETYAVLMELVGPNGKTANVMTAWIDDRNSG